MNLEFKVQKQLPEEVSRLHTIVFIDYESLYVGFIKQCAIQPPLDVIIDEVKENGKISKIKVFGDFTKQDLSQERKRIRTITSDIIDCGNEASVLKKDFSDFIMLDHIYQEIIQNPTVEQFILFTGDGHFSSVATFMRMFMDKTVGVYSVIGTMSRQLRECSSWSKLICPISDEDIDYQANLLKNLKSASEKGIIATFFKTIEHTMRVFGGDRIAYEDSLRHLLDEGYIRSELCTSYADRQFNMLVADWERIEDELEF